MPVCIAVIHVPCEQDSKLVCPKQAVRGSCSQEQLKSEAPLLADAMTTTQLLRLKYMTCDAGSVS